MDLWQPEIFFDDNDNLRLRKPENEQLQQRLAKASDCFLKGLTSETGELFDVLMALSEIRSYQQSLQKKVIRKRVILTKLKQDRLLLEEDS